MDNRPLIQKVNFITDSLKDLMADATNDDLQFLQTTIERLRQASDADLKEASDEIYACDAAIKEYFHPIRGNIFNFGRRQQLYRLLIAKSCFLGGKLAGLH